MGISKSTEAKNVLETIGCRVDLPVTPFVSLKWKYIKGCIRFWKTSGWTSEIDLNQLKTILSHPGEFDEASLWVENGSVEGTVNFEKPSVIPSIMGAEEFEEMPCDLKMNDLRAAFAMFAEFPNDTIKVFEVFAFMVVTSYASLQQRIRNLFRIFDLDNDGSLNKEEMTHFLHSVLGALIKTTTNRELKPVKGVLGLPGFHEEETLRREKANRKSALELLAQVCEQAFFVADRLHHFKVTYLEWIQFMRGNPDAVLLMKRFNYIFPERERLRTVPLDSVEEDEPDAVLSHEHQSRHKKISSSRVQTVKQPRLIRSWRDSEAAAQRIIPIPPQLREMYEKDSADHPQTGKVRRLSYGQDPVPHQRGKVKSSQGYNRYRLSSLPSCKVTFSSESGTGCGSPASMFPFTSPRAVSDPEHYESFFQPQPPPGQKSASRPRNTSSLPRSSRPSSPKRTISAQSGPRPTRPSSHTGSQMIDFSPIEKSNADKRNEVPKPQKPVSVQNSTATADLPSAHNSLKYKNGNISHETSTNRKRLEYDYRRRSKTPQLGLKYTKKDIMLVKAEFDTIDRDGSGEVELGELAQSLKGQVPDEWMHGMFNAMDADGNGKVSLKEMLMIMFPFATKKDTTQWKKWLVKHPHTPSREEENKKRNESYDGSTVQELTHLFKLFDLNGDENLSVEELIIAMSETKGIEKKDVHRIMNEAGYSSDSPLDLQAFIDIFAPVAQRKFFDIQKDLGPLAQRLQRLQEDEITRHRKLVW